MNIFFLDLFRQRAVAHLLALIWS